CADCAMPYSPSADEVAVLVHDYGADEFAALGVPADESLPLMRGKGCDSCKLTGYRRRTAIHDLLVPSDRVNAMILGRARVQGIRGQAWREGMTTLVQDGIVKVLAGLTDFRQVKAVAIR